MRIEGKGIIKEIRQVKARGINNFQFRGVLLEIEQRVHYVEALGNFVGALDAYQTNQPVKFILEFSTPSKRDNPNEYWTNVNLIGIELDEPTLGITEQKASIQAQTTSEKLDDDLPF